MGRKIHWVLMLLLTLIATAGADTLIPITIQTSLGEIEVELNASKAPLTTKNFLRYVDAGLFANTSFYRTVTTKPDNQPQNRVKIDVIQGGIDFGPSAKRFAEIALERTKTTGLKHRHGTISMARLGPDTGSSEFFICIGDQPELDFGGARNPDGQGFAAFGQVTKGFAVVNKIHHSKTRDAGQMLEPVILIQNIRRAR